MWKVLSDPLHYPRSQALAERTPAAQETQAKRPKRKAKNW